MVATATLLAFDRPPFSWRKATDRYVSRTHKQALMRTREQHSRNQTGNCIGENCLDPTRMLPRNRNGYPYRPPFPLPLYLAHWNFRLPVPFLRYPASLMAIALLLTMLDLLIDLLVYYISGTSCNCFPGN